MRIKEVCQATGLTDKAIRFYINQELLSPDYTENYAGRKNYFFSEQDIAALNKISLLRKYDFSVNDIRQMLCDNSVIDEILENHIYEIKNNTAQSRILLNNLLNASISNSKSVDDLCSALEECREIEIQKKESDNTEKYLKRYWHKAKSKIPKLIIIATGAVITAIALIILLIFTLSKLFMNMGISP